MMAVWFSPIFQLLEDKSWHKFEPFYRSATIFNNGSYISTILLRTTRRCTQITEGKKPYIQFCVSMAAAKMAKKVEVAVERPFKDRQTWLTSVALKTTDVLTDFFRADTIFLL